jgi:hypothetical protein
MTNSVTSNVVTPRANPDVRSEAVTLVSTI